MAELERATAERATRVLLLRAPRGAGRTAVLREAAQALRERGVPHTLVACEALGGERGAALDAFVRDRLADPAVGGHSPSGGGGSVHPGDEHTSSTAGSSTGS